MNISKRKYVSSTEVKYLIFYNYQKNRKNFKYAYSISLCESFYDKYPFKYHIKILQ